MGLGFLVAGRGWSFLRWTPLLLALLVVCARVFPVSVDRSGSDLIYFTALHTTGPPAWLILPLVFLLVAGILVGPAEVVGRCFAELAPLTAYRWDLIGSLLGILLFTALSLVWAPSVVWGVLVAVAFTVLVGGRFRALAALAGIVVVGALLLETTTPGVSWSPYYKVTQTTKTSETYGKRVQLSVNGVPHQTMATAAWKLEKASRIYGAPYLHRDPTPLGNVLVVGAGSGSDVAIALRMGAQHVDAVDIDPRLVQIGVQGNPDHVYQIGRAHV